MITKIDSTNQAKYDILFANAMKDLRKNPDWADVEINSLESYFSNINKLLNLKDKSVDYCRRYTILPLDENYFSIDTNTRMIEVPASFRKNGVGVQGDMGAETIYFKVPRYFDAVDLNNTDIYIQWQYTNSQNGQSEQGISHEWVRDIESEDDYLIFGWVLGGRITEEAGSLQFSVRFIRGQKDDDKNITNISYSLSTLTATVMINPGLNYDIDMPGMVETLDDIISSNFIDTTTKTDSEIDIFRYVWDLDRLFIGQLEEGKKIPVTIERDLDSNGKLKIQLSSYVSPGEILSYSLYKQTKDEPSINMDSETKIDMNIEYLPTEDKTYQENGPKMYYEEKLDDEGNPKYSRYWPENLNNTSLPEGLKEKYGTITIDKNTMDNIAGTYYGVARAVINGNQSGPQYTNHKLLIAGPVKPILDSENTVYTKYTVDTNEDGTIEYPILPVLLKEYGEKDTITFSWYRLISEVIEDNKVNRNGEFIKDTETTDSFIPETTGKYYAVIKSTRNFTDSEVIETNNYIVTEKPKAPVIPENGQPKSGALSLPIEFIAIDQNDTTITNSQLIYNLYSVKYDGETPRYAYKATSNEPKFVVNTADNYACGVYSKYNDLESKITYTNVIVRQ